VVHTFVDHRQVDEQFIDTFNRIGLEPFKERVYPSRLEALV
jgi:sulfite reductase (NADPH) hemoprotein beta-component